jgi:glycosyltransferase involved in cell wall biosynthesis
MITVAIPTMKRWSFLKTMLPVFLGRPEVKEVVLCDETGEDYQAAAAAFSKNPKLRLYKNETRLGIYENKKKALSLCSGWVALLDSDNVFPDEWFDFLSELDFSDKRRIYGSADFKNLHADTGKVDRPCAKFSGTVLNKDTWNLFLHNDKCFYLLNDGNWILHADAVAVLPATKSDAVQAADAVYTLWTLVKNGYSAHYPAGLEYIHMTHAGSSWLQSQDASLKVLLGTDWRI